MRKTPTKYGGAYAGHPDDYCAPTATCTWNNRFGYGRINVARTLCAAAGNQPQVQQVTPTFGPMSGGTNVAITGACFLNVENVSFTPVTNAYGPTAIPAVISPSQMTVLSPPNGSGWTDIIVNAGRNSSSRTPADRFGYFPGVTSVSPAFGPMQGHMPVTLTGSGLSKGMTVYFGSNEATNPYCSDSTSCSVINPAAQALGPVDVRVSVAGVMSPTNPGDRFTYLGPTVTRIDPAIGQEIGGDHVWLYGASLQDGMIVRFGETKSQYGATCQDTTWCMTISPSGTGVVNVSVEVNGVRSGQSAGSLFTYAKYPTVAGVVPASGPATGGTSVTVAGTNFSTNPGATTIVFGSKPATKVSCTPTQCMATTPPGAATVDVVVSVNNLASKKSASSRFSYVPVVTGLTPSNGPANGGTQVQIMGAGFFADKFGSQASVAFGPNQASYAVCSSPASCTAKSPAGSGTVDVRVTLDGYTSGVTPADKFSYNTAGNNRGWTHWNLQPELTKSGSSLTYDPIRRQVVYVDLKVVSSDPEPCPDCPRPPPPPPPTYVGETWTWAVDSNNWTQESPRQGRSLSSSAFAYDDSTGTAVLFGGLMHVKFNASPRNQTWIWDGANWTMAAPAVSPPARYNASMAYDVTRNKVILFGGCADHLCTSVLNDTWTWDGTNWKQETPASSPPARSQAAMAYNAAGGHVVLFGGRTTSGPLGDMWRWEGQTWTQLNPQALPAARSGAGLAYSAADSGLVLFGGTGSAGYLNDTWLWNASGWTQAHPAASPAALGDVVGMTYDAAMKLPYW